MYDIILVNIEMKCLQLCVNSIQYLQWISHSDLLQICLFGQLNFSECYLFSGICCDV